MDRRFIRYVLLILIGLAAMVWLADQAYLRKQQQVPGPAAIALTTMLSGYCRQNECTAGASPWPGLYFLHRGELMLPEAEAATLRSGQLIRAHASGREYFYYYQVGDRIAQLGPLQEMEAAENPWYSQLFYPLLGLAILLTLLPVVRDLQGLKEAATRFARDRNPQHFQFRHSGFFTPVTDAMVWMSQRLARTLALQQELSATLSHELRTPISRLKFVAASLPAGCSQEELHGDLDELEQLVAEYLTFAKLEHERPLLDFVAADARELVEPLLNRLGQYSNKHINLQVLAPIHPVSVDRRSIGRALKNLIDNGIKYARTEIRVSLRESAGEVAFVIEDDGPGLEGQGLEDIFLPYVRESQASQISGYGLGLAIVRRIVDWHSGRMVVGASEVLGGARFELWLPAATAQEQKER